MVEHGSTIYPTHKCFDDALEFLDELVKQENPMFHSGRLMLVHGICLHPDDGHEYAHAWVEQDDEFVIFAGIYNGNHQYFAAKRIEFYAESNVQETTKYTPVQAVKENLRSGHFGPWIEKYQNLCREKIRNQKASTT